jgi:hypothetical protein
VKCVGLTEKDVGEYWPVTAQLWALGFGTHRAGPNSTVGPVPAGVAWDGDCIHHV